MSKERLGVTRLLMCHWFSIAWISVFSTTIGGGFLASTLAFGNAPRDDMWHLSNLSVAQLQGTP